MKEKLLVTGNLAKDVFDGKEKFGGSAANLALAAQRLGIKVSIMSVMGKDDFSKKYRDYLLENGIDLTLTTHDLTTTCVDVISKKTASCLWQDNGCEEAMSELNVDREFR
jgi:sugar/nucleoside kinase (ribokinase family)